MIMYYVVNRIVNNQVDLPSRVGLDLAGWYPTTAVDRAIEYYKFDWEMGEDPEISSLEYAMINDNWTCTSFGPDSDGDLFVMDPRYMIVSSQ